MVASLLAAAMLCAFLTLCGLFYQGQWQFALHPSARSTASTAALAYQDVRFDFTETGQPLLHGWWIPAPAGATRYSDVTVLYLHGGEGPFANAAPRLLQLHNLGLNVFAFDYRGFGQSAGPHPDEARMREDAEAAWTYLALTRKTPATNLVVYAEGVGIPLAAGLLQQHPRVPAVILEDPVFDLVQQVLHDPRAGLVPAHLLFRQRFDVAASLSTLSLPKLIFLSDGPHTPTAQQLAGIADPKFIMHFGTLSPAAAEEQRTRSLRRFLDEYLPAPALLPQ